MAKPKGTAKPAKSRALPGTPKSDGARTRSSGVKQPRDVAPTVPQPAASVASVAPAPRKRPAADEYYMTIAMAVRRRANCLGQRVGAVLVRDNRIISTGYNGTPMGMMNCDEGGCDRCGNRARYGPGQAYDVCLCVHAEQNAILAAARFGISVAESTMYTTTRPCFGCTKELLQAKIEQVYFIHDWKHPNEEVWEEYKRVQDRIPRGIRRLDLADPDERWAKGLT